MEGLALTPGSLTVLGTVLSFFPVLPPKGSVQALALFLFEDGDPKFDLQTDALTVPHSPLHFCTWGSAQSGQSRMLDSPASATLSPSLPVLETEMTLLWVVSCCLRTGLSQLTEI